MYLVDTNVWLERLLNQDKSDEVGKFLSRVPAGDLYLSDFTFHSICVVLTRLAKSSALLDFVQDVFVDGGVNLVSIKPHDTQDLVNVINAHNFDFDDAYQYLAAKQNDLILVSFDTDFDRIENARRAPGEILSEATESE